MPLQENQNMRAKFTSIICVICVAVFFAGCGTSTSTNSSAANTDINAGNSVASSGSSGNYIMALPGSLQDYTLEKPGSLGDWFLYRNSAGQIVMVRIDPLNGQDDTGYVNAVSNELGSDAVTDRSVAELPTPNAYFFKAGSQGNPGFQGISFVVRGYGVRVGSTETAATPIPQDRERYLAFAKALVSQLSG
jgi:hypothetical protein